MDEQRRRRRPQMIEIERQRELETQQAQKEARCSAEPPPLWEDKPPRQIEIELRSAHGSGAAERRKRHEARRRQIIGERIRFALMAACVVVAVVSLSMIANIVTRSIRTRATNRELAQKRAELAAAPEETAQIPVLMPEETAVPEATQTPAAQTTAPEDATTAPDAGSTPAPAKKDVVKSTKYHVAGGEALGHMEALYEENRDLIGWLRMEEILDLPVMYRDNSYYLKRDFYKNKNDSGTLFLDENHKFGEYTQNLLLHGHNMKDGTMFGRLTQFLNLSYMKNNPFVYFDTLWREEQYVIFAVLRVSLDVKDERFFNYFSYPTFASDAEFAAYVRRLQLKSEYAIPIDVEPSDALLTLSTCLDDDRLVIVCRRVRENETRSELRQSIRLTVKQ